MSSDVKVAIKLRPLIEQEQDENLSIQWIVKENSIVSLNQETKKLEDNEFHFDYNFDMNTKNCNVFDNIIKPIVDDVMNGFNGTIFCYGQINSGKTYTMIGSSEDPGIIPLSIEYIFNAISNIINRVFILRVSYLEICNEKINDLLNKNQVDLKLYKDDNGQIIIKCKEEIANSANYMLSIMKEGIKNKKIQEKNRNEHIYSHSIFKIIIESQEIDDDPKNIIQVSQLSLIDLAGFEKGYCTTNVEECQRDISLFTLESIITQINKSQNFQKHADYHSKLTELLQSSLSGNALIAMICTIIPVALEETYCTLSFATQAKNIKTKPQKNEITSNASLLIRYTKQLKKLQTELEQIRNEDSSIEEIEYNKLQQRYQIDYLLEERIKLLKNQIISGCTKSYEKPIKYKSRKRQTWCNSGMIKQYLPILHIQNCLPTINEISPEKTYKKNVQSIDIVDQTFHTAFTDFELELLDREADYEIKETDSIENEYISNESNIKFKTDDFFLKSEKQDSSVQTSSNEISPSTPKSVLRKYILDLTTDLNELREFTTLEKQLMCEDCKHNVKQVKKQIITTDFKNDEIIECSPNLIIELQKEKSKLSEDSKLKVQKTDEIKNDFQSLKLDIKELQKTIYLLTNENMEMLNKLSAEKERSEQTELNFQKTIDELYGRISKVTDEKINLETDIEMLNNQLQNFRSKTEEDNDEQLIIKYQNKIDTLKIENIELSAIIDERNKELENIKESKSLLYDHDCIYKDEVALLTEKNKCLIMENNEFSTDLINKIEENETLKEQCNILESKIYLMKNANSDESDIDQLRLENNILKAEIAELKIKITMLTDENTKFSNNLLKTINDLDYSRNEKINSNMYLCIELDNSKEKNQIVKKTLQEEDNELLKNKVTKLQNENIHLSHLNKKLSDLKLSSCSQCIYLKTVNENRTAHKIKEKILNCKLENLQKKFDRKCAEADALKRKANQDLNLTLTDISLNTNCIGGMNVSSVEEEIQHLNNELQVLKNNHDELWVLYEEKCDELEKLHDIGDSKNIDDGCKLKKCVFKNKRKLDELQNHVDQVKGDIGELKKEFRTERESFLEKINVLKNINEKLQQEISDKEISVITVTEKAQIFETELSNMNKEIEQFFMKEKLMQTEKLTLEVELEDLKMDQRNKDILISKLNITINELNEVVSSLKKELDSISNQKNELIISIEKIEYKYKEELKLLKQQYDRLEQEKQNNIEIEKRATLWEFEKKIFKLENFLQENENEKETYKEKLKVLETQLINSKDNSIIKESEINTNKRLQKELNTVKECMIRELTSLKCKIHSLNFSNKTANEIFIIFLQTLMLKEEEVIKEMRELFEKEKQELDDKRQQSADAEKRVILWSKELENENEKLHTDLTKTERLCTEQQDKIYQLEYLLKENNYEKEILKEKIEVMEIDFNNLQSEFDKRCKVDIQQKGEADIIAQKREKEVQEAFKHKEIELQSKIKFEEEQYKKKIEELISSIEIYKTKNIELKNNIEGLEANEKQLKNIIEINSSELKINNQSIQKMSFDFEQLTEAYNELTNEVEQKTIQIENITTLLKNKCDLLSEYKAKLENMIPDYEMLQKQSKERKENIERYKEEIEKLEMEKRKKIEIIEDKLNSEEIKNIGLNKQLNELNSKNINLIDELDNLKEKYEELQQVNAKLERKIRNSTSKIKAETEMEELKDMNKRLQNNLEGASNRIIELQESKNKTFKELVNLKNQYELLSQENVEIKKSLSLYKFKQTTLYLSQEDSKYDVLLQEKNKIALELEDKKLLLIQKEKEINEYMNQIKDFVIKKKQFDNQLIEYSTTLCKCNIEISNLKDEVCTQQTKTKLINELEKKLKILEEENKNLTCQLETFKIKIETNMKQIEDTKLHNEKTLYTLKKNLELQMKYNDYQNELEIKTNSNNSSRSTSPAFENNRRRRSRNEIFNQRRQLENVMIDIDSTENEEICQILRKKIQELELQLVSKNGQIAALEIQIQSENFPYQQKCKELEELLLMFRKKNTELNSEVRKLQRTLYDINTWECDICRRWRINKRDQACQTIFNNAPQLFTTNNEIIENHIKIRKLEKEKELIKDICRARCRQIKNLEDKNEMKENVPANTLMKVYEIIKF
ncbi:Centromere-associated protein E [Apis cerana cerana]|uniref:Centromere-associated protein E n=1 Tax=Apis cerana cerana TaxID=94128 RepID=A0A2A3ELN5_APICC|nr:Centromere-associated protein E [Apis cerana cerana]